MRSKIFLVLILTALMCLAGWTAHARLEANTAAQNWEYMVMELDERFQTVPKLNQYGAQGWELVSVIAGCPEGSASCRIAAYLKRAK